MANMDFNDLIIKAFKAPEVKFCLETEFNRVIKSSKLAYQIMEEGNEMFRECKHNARMHERIWDSYMCSIVLSPNKSETLASSYGEMSTLMHHLYKHKDCIRNIDRALDITKSPSLKARLLSLKAKCLGILGMSEKDSVFEEATCLLKKIGNKHNCSERMSQFVDKVKTALDQPKMEESRQINENKHLEILSQKDLENVFNSVAVSENNEYNRHLVATRDIRPGEIIFVAKPYIRVTNIKRTQNFCNHCMRTVWCGIPCDNCAYSMYCSEECQKEANKKYHDIECSILQFILRGNSLLDYQIHASMRAVIMAVKEFGNIANLRDEINSIDNCTDVKEFYKGDKYHESFTNIFGFKNIYVDPATLSQLAKSCCRVVIGLAKFASFFEENCKFSTIEDVTKNDDAIFIGSLLLRVAVIIYNNGVKIREADILCKNGMDQTACASSIPCCERGYSLNTLSYLMPHSCNPNVKSIKTEDCRELWYALQPIPKGNPLFECYGSTFFEMELTQRKQAIAHVLNRNCNCVACIQEWPASLVLSGQLMSYDDIFKTVVDSREYESEKQKFVNLVSKRGLSHQKTIDELSNILEASYDYFGQPSAEVCAAICLLHYSFNGLYGMKFNMPDKCRAVKT